MKTNYYSVIERLLMSKTSIFSDSEDAIILNNNFAAVVDGATSKSEQLWEGKTGGQVVTFILKKAIESLPFDCSAFEAASLLTKAIANFYNNHNIYEIARIEPLRRITASMALYSCAAREVWLIGDCQAIIDDCYYNGFKALDTIVAKVRAAVLDIALAEGDSIETLTYADPGREFIYPLLRRQAVLQNNPEAGELWFPVLDGFEVPLSGIKIIKVPDQDSDIVLATDGYPYLRSSLEASESELKVLIDSDPLMFRKYKSTKGVAPGNSSFDDRAYLKLRVGPQA